MTQLRTHCMRPYTVNCIHQKKYSWFRNEIRSKIQITFIYVVPPGIEPGTQGFSVLCSTNWAMAPSCLLHHTIGVTALSSAKASAKVLFFICSRKFFRRKMLIIEKIAVPLHPQTGCSAVGSALRSGRRGRAFESPHPDSTGAGKVWPCLR